MSRSDPATSRGIDKRPLFSLAWLPAPLRGVIALVLLLTNTLFWCVLLFGLAIPRLLLPWPAARRRLDPVLNGMATCWIAGNKAWMRLTQPTRWDVEGDESDEGYSTRSWYLVVCNHQSWVDIFVLQYVLNRRIPMLKFFLKQELLYVPIMGLAWWALDFPFMRRHSEEVLRRNPQKRQEDLDAARRACAKFALAPTSVMNFVEGTRFTPAKHAAAGGRWTHLLPPKAGGLAMAAAVLGERFEALVDATIVYPYGAPSFWDFLCGRVPRIVVRIQRQEIPADCRRSDGAMDSPFRKRVHRWLLSLWDQKDRQIEALLAGGAGPLAAAPGQTVPAADRPA
ncbi:MAG TPA: acyltransferase [Rubrivivax sp.]|nr:acyltransferase [Burkholderiales bacterium]HNU11769.1 acyltransferase [Rubrivivax sp.]